MRLFSRNKNKKHLEIIQVEMENIQNQVTFLRNWLQTGLLLYLRVLFFRFYFFVFLRCILRTLVFILWFLVGSSLLFAEFTFLFSFLSFSVLRYLRGLFIFFRTHHKIHLIVDRMSWLF